MGAGSSSYRPKAIYLDIDGRIQKNEKNLSRACWPRWRNNFPERLRSTS
uniref:Phosphodiesterase 9A n=1 Tax=Mus musculus TaxID=10090 RepID=A0A494B907_MOUSE